MKLNFKVFAKISAVGLVLITLAKVLLPVGGFLAVSALIGVGIASVYYSYCDAEGMVRDTKATRRKNE